MLEIKNINKKYGKNLVLDNFSYNIESGNIIGILGPNGSGKTTLLKIIKGYLLPSSGEIFLDGKKIDYLSNSQISYLPDVNFMDENLTVEQGIYLFNNFFEDFRVDKMISMLELMKLDKNKKIKELSKGMKEKYNLALILSRKARLYIIDEPISGVDLISRDEIINFIVTNIEEDTTMIITTHFAEEMDKIFDEIIYLNDGKIIESGKIDDLIEKYELSITDIYRTILGGKK